MNENENLVPKRRFKEFTNTGTWEQRKLEDLGSFKNGMNFDKSAMGHGHPFINLQNIFGKTVVDDKDLGLAVSSEKQRNEYNLLKGDILFIRSSVKPEGVGEAALVPKNFENTTFSGFIIRFRPHITVDDEFKRVIFATKTVRNQIMALATSSANTNINQISLGKIIIELPELSEQSKIGNLFKQLDNAIALHQRKLTLLEQLKQTYQLGMFPHNGGSIPALRFAGFSEPWEQRKLNDLYEKGGSGGTPQSTNKSYYMGDIPFLGISDISASNGYIYDTEKHISEKGLNNSSAWIVPKEAISLAMYASVGKVAILKTEAATSQAFYNMVFKKISTRNFIFQYLLKIESTNGWNRLISTGTQANLNAQKVRDLEIMIPSLEEQDKIGTFFNRIDHTIDLHQKKISHIQDLKKALLQKMFI